MHNKLKKHALILMNVFLLLMTIYCFTYLEGNAKSNYGLIYGMSSNMRHYTSNFVSINTYDVLNSVEGNDIVIISELGNTNALYDPGFYYYNQMYVHLKGHFRYFNVIDYHERRNVGIKVVDTIDEVISNFDLCKATNGSTFQDILFCIPKESHLVGDNHVEYISNLTFYEKIGNSVYVDSSEKNVLTKIDEIFLNNGYEISTTRRHIDLRSILGIVFMNPRNLAFTIIFTLSLALSYFAINEAIHNERRSIAIHYSYGGARSNIMYEFSKKYLLVNLIAVSIFATMFYLLKNYIPFHNDTTFGIIVISSLVVLIYTSVTYLMILQKYVNKQFKIKEGSKYVR